MSQAPRLSWNPGTSEAPLASSPPPLPAQDEFASLRQELTVQAEISPDLLRLAKGDAVGAAALGIELPDERQDLARRQQAETIRPPAAPASAGDIEVRVPPLHSSILPRVAESLMQGESVPREPSAFASYPPVIERPAPVFMPQPAAFDLDADDLESPFASGPKRLVQRVFRHWLVLSVVAYLMIALATRIIAG